MLGTGAVILWAILFFRGTLRYAVPVLGVYVINALLIFEEKREKAGRELAIAFLPVLIGVIMISFSSGILEKMGLIVALGGLFVLNLNAGSND